LRLHGLPATNGRLTLGPELDVPGVDALQERVDALERGDWSVLQGASVDR